MSSRRNRKPPPHQPVQVNFVTAPVDVLTWRGRELVLHVPVRSACGEFVQIAAKWKVLQVRDIPGHMTLLGTDPCERCGFSPRLQVEAALLRDPKIAGWLPL